MPSKIEQIPPVPIRCRQNLIGTNYNSRWCCPNCNQCQLEPLVSPKIWIGAKWSLWYLRYFHFWWYEIFLLVSIHLLMLLMAPFDVNSNFDHTNGWRQTNFCSYKRLYLAPNCLFLAPMAPLNANSSVDCTNGSIWRKTIFFGQQWLYLTPN